MWIYEQPLWPHVYYNETSVTALVNTIKEMRKELSRKIMSTFDSKTGNRIHHVLAYEIMCSSATENEDIYSMKDILDLIKVEYDFGLVGIYLDIIHNSQNSITEQRILQWHKLLFAEKEDEITFKIGEWRDHDDVGINDRFGVIYEAPSYSIIQDEMMRFICQLQGDDDDDLIKAAIYPLYFLICHPLPDGNGRISRCLMVYFLFRSSPELYFSISAQLLKVKIQYHKKLYLVQRGDLDVTTWMRWFLMQIMNSIQSEL